jgi:hypothetical protein
MTTLVVADGLFLVMGYSTLQTFNKWFHFVLYLQFR